jgi:hypothetical protein
VNRTSRTAVSAVTAGLLAAGLLTGCGSGTDRAVPGPTTPPKASPAGTDDVASAEPALATTGATSSPATDGTTVDAAEATDDTATTGAPGAVGATGTATAGLVDGFPRDVLPVMPGAKVTASAVRTAGDRLELSLSGRTARSAADVLAFYDKALRAKGFTAAGGGPTIAPGTGGRIYARGDEVVVLAVTRADGAVSFSVGGTVRA